MICGSFCFRVSVLQDCSFLVPRAMTAPPETTDVEYVDRCAPVQTALVELWASKLCWRLPIGESEREEFVMHDLETIREGCINLLRVLPSYSTTARTAVCTLADVLTSIRSHVLQVQYIETPVSCIPTGIPKVPYGFSMVEIMRARKPKNVFEGLIDCRDMFNEHINLLYKDEGEEVDRVMDVVMCCMEDTLSLAYLLLPVDPIKGPAGRDFFGDFFDQMD